MKILIYGMNYSPELTGVGRFTGEMGSWLADRGHEVLAITAPPYYPAWKVNEGYARWWFQKDVIDRVTVVRCPIWVPSRQSAFGRLILQFSFVFSSFLYIWLKAITFRPNVVWTVMPPTAGLPIAKVAAFLGGAFSWVHVQDFEVDAAFELSMLKSLFLRRILLRLEAWLLSSFDVVSTITPRMREKLSAKGLSSRVGLMPNWVDLENIWPIDDVKETRPEWNFPLDAFVCLYSGNLGEKQGVDDLVELARKLSDFPDVLVTICGNGAGRGRLEALASGVQNVRFLPLQPMDKLNLLLNVADVHLLPQRPEIADLVMPSKLGGMLASGRPVVASVEEGTQVAEEIRDCGIAVPPGDVDAMARAVLHLRSRPDLRRQMGANAVRRAQENWEKSTIVAAFESALQSLVEKGRRHRT